MYLRRRSPVVGAPFGVMMFWKPDVQGIPLRRSNQASVRCSTLWIRIFFLLLLAPFVVSYQRSKNFAVPGGRDIPATTFDAGRKGRA